MSKNKMALPMPTQKGEEISLSLTNILDNNQNQNVKFKEQTQDFDLAKEFDEFPKDLRSRTDLVSEILESNEDILNSLIESILNLKIKEPKTNIEKTLNMAIDTIAKATTNTALKIESNNKEINKTL